MFDFKSFVLTAIPVVEAEVEELSDLVWSLERFVVNLEDIDVWLIFWESLEVIANVDKEEEVFLLMLDDIVLVWL